MRNIPINHTVFRASILGFMIISAPGCQKSVIQAFVDAQVENDRSLPRIQMEHGVNFGKMVDSMKKSQ